MARGWESKSVESQIESSKDGNVSGSRAAASEKEKEIRREQQSLMLSRTYVLRQLESSSNERYKQSLRQALHDIDEKIAGLGGQ